MISFSVGVEGRVGEDCEYWSFSIVWINFVGVMLQVLELFYPYKHHLLKLMIIYFLKYYKYLDMTSWIVINWPFLSLFLSIYVWMFFYLFFCFRHGLKRNKYWNDYFNSAGMRLAPYVYHAGLNQSQVLPSWVSQGDSTLTCLLPAFKSDLDNSREVSTA